MNNKVIIAWHFEFDISKPSLFFYNMRFRIERVVWDKRNFWFDFIYQGSISASQTFLFSHHTSEGSFQYFCYERVLKWKNIHKIILSLFDRIKKKLWDCWITDEINIESNGTIIVFFNSSERKGGKWIIYRSGFDRSSTLGKSRFHSRAVCNAQKMPVRFFNSIFSCLFRSLR